VRWFTSVPFVMYNKGWRRLRPWLNHKIYYSKWEVVRNVCQMLFEQVVLDTSTLCNFDNDSFIHSNCQSLDTLPTMDRHAPMARERHSVTWKSFTLKYWIKKINFQVSYIHWPAKLLYGQGVTLRFAIAASVSQRPSESVLFRWVIQLSSNVQNFNIGPHINI
jgi:hypothetical protein